MSIADFWHEGGGQKPAGAPAIKIYTPHCGECGIQLDRSRLPCNCDKGHYNDRRIAEFVLTYHCSGLASKGGHCGLQLDKSHWPAYCAKGHRNEYPE